MASFFKEIQIMNCCLLLCLAFNLSNGRHQFAVFTLLELDLFDCHLYNGNVLLFFRLYSLVYGST